MSRGLTLIIIFLICGLGTAVPSVAASLPETYAKIKPSLALVAYKEGRYIVTGSSFCIGSTDDRSFFLTNAHVVGGRKSVYVFLSSSPARALVGTVVRTNTTLDAAVIEVFVGGIPPLRLARDTLPEGKEIAIAGYPSAQLELAIAGLGLTPSVHEGIINAYPANGFLVEFDAQVEHGNSGGPIFDPDTGAVYGIVTLKLGNDQTNFGVTIGQLFPFISNANIALSGTSGGEKFGEASTPTNPPHDSGQLRNRIFDTYIPLRDRDQFYDCGSGRRYTMQIRQYGTGAYYTVTDLWSGFSSNTSSETLHAHDSLDDILFIGQFDQNASLQPLGTAVVAVPIRPSESFAMTMPLADGSTDIRRWIGSSTLDLPAGRYDVEIYRIPTIGLASRRQQRTRIKLDSLR